MVLGRGWQYFCRRHRIVPVDLVVVWISVMSLKVQIYNHDSSIMCRVCCTKHSCVSDFFRAL